MNRLVNVCPSKLHSIRSQAFVLWPLWSFPKPRPSMEWKEATKCGECFLPRPSSPCSNKGTALFKSSAPDAALPNTSWVGCSCWKFFQKLVSMDSSLATFGFSSPWRMCMQELATKKENQSRILRMGIFMFPSKCDFCTGSDNPYCFAMTWWPSLSGWVGLQRATSNNPPDFSAAFAPTSSMKSRAAGMAEV